MEKSDRLQVKYATTSLSQRLPLANLAEETFESVKGLLAGMLHNSSC